MAIEHLVAFRKDPTEIKDGYQETVLHVGAVYDKLEELKAVLEPRFDSAPRFKKERFSNSGKTGPEIPAKGETFEFPNTEYLLTGNIHGIEYVVSLENIGCPVPFSMAQIHHASVRLPEGRTDEMTPIIELEFRKYETEFNACIRVAEANLQEAIR